MRRRDLKTRVWRTNRPGWPSIGAGGFGILLAGFLWARGETPPASVAPVLRPAEISRVAVRARHWGWDDVKTNLVLVRRNAQFMTAGYRVSDAVVSNLMASVAQPPRAEVDPTDLGLTESWLATNRTKLLESFAGETGRGIFPLASARQRAWLTNALFDLDVLRALVRGVNHRIWTDDYPEMDVVFWRGEAEIVRLQSTEQNPFMLPWEVSWNTNQFRTYNAGIGRALAALLPAGFLNRDRLQGDLIAIIARDFPNHPRVQQEMAWMVSEETLGARTNELFAAFDFQPWSLGSGNYGRYPETWNATLRRTNWPVRLTMPLRMAIADGVAPMLPQIMDNADTRVSPLLNSRWAAGLTERSADFSLEVAPAGSMADDRYLRGHMAKVGLDEFYDQVVPLMRQGLAFILREGNKRTSEWVVLPNGNFLLVKFAGDGVLDWSPSELGFRGNPSDLQGISYNMVGVFLTPDGRIERVVPRVDR